MTNPTFVRTSYLGEDLASTIAMLHNESLAPLMIAPMPNDASIATITRELVMPGTQPVFGPTTNFKKVAPGAWSFQVWSAYRQPDPAQRREFFFRPVFATPLQIKTKP